MTRTTAFTVVAVSLLVLGGGLALGPGLGAARATTFAVCGDARENTTVGTAGDDRLVGDDFGPCHDTMYGRGGDDLLRGLRLSDELYGGNGADTVYGGRGNDRLDGGSGNDALYGGYGDDVIDAQDPDPFPGQRDVVDCGPGFDVAYTDERDARTRGCEEVGLIIQ